MQYIFVLGLLSLAECAPLFPIPGLLMNSPMEDPFYKAPNDLNKYNYGEIYDSRPVGINLPLQVMLSQATQVAYKTKGVYDEDSHSIATLFKPSVPCKEPKIFSYQFWEDSANLNCSPSYTMAKGLLSPNWPSAALDTAAAIQWALSKGWYVVAADHEGPHSAFIEGYTEGRAGLDGIRAAINFFNLRKDTPVALYGYSGGASATVWMANLHESHASELNIVGAAYGGTPVDLLDIIQWLDRTDRQFSGFILGAFGGLMQAYSDVNKTSWEFFHDSLKESINKVTSPNFCLLNEVLGYHNTEFKTQMDPAIFAHQPFLDMLYRESLLKSFNTGILSTPKFPRYMFHAIDDEVLPFASVEKYVREQCDSGADIQWVTWRNNTHMNTEFLGIPDAFQFLQQAMNNETPKIPCGTARNDTLTLASRAARDILGKPVTDLLNGLNGLTTPMGKIEFDPAQTP